ncbi:hypothetical protein DV738_g3527, partial [Chaetothyriales sp. CBS 135597]
MSLPPPTTSFTIPSLHDDLELDCRIYYPRSSGPSRPGQNYGIIAHPYAPLGGSYDDPVVARAGNVLLQHGILLGTFNFRGAAGSAGRTSWSGKGELGDYVAFYLFMLAFINATKAQLTGEESQDVEETIQPLLVLGGYSYGSMIASSLPPIDLVQALLGNTPEGSTEYEIKSRADQLGKDYAAYVKLQREGSSIRAQGGSHASHTSEVNSPPGRMGGYRSEEANRRISGQSGRSSVDRGNSVRRSLDRVRQRLGKNRDMLAGSIANPDHSTRQQASGCPTVAYLLISPVLPPVSGFTTMFSKPSFERQLPGSTRQLKDESASQDKFQKCATCIVYGGKDQFTSSKKIKKWTHELEERSANPSLLCAQEVEQAGHFWVEAPGRLQAIVGQWLLTLLGTKARI